MFSAKTLTKDQIQAFVDAYNDGKATLASVAKEIGCSVPTAGRVLKANGANMRAKGRPKGSKTVNRKPRLTVTTVAPADLTPQAQAEVDPVEKGENFLAFQQRIMAGLPQ